MTDACKKVFLYLVPCTLYLIFLSACDTPATTGDRIRLEITPAATPTPTSPAQPTVPPTAYTVRSGDTLSAIAALFGLAVDDLVRANNIADPNSLTVGQVLTIPARAPGTPVSGPTPTPEFPPGPTLPPPDVTPPLGPTTPPDE